MPIPVDTPHEIEAFQLDLLRRKSPQERLALVERLTSDVIHASKTAIARIHPDYTDLEVGDAFIELHYGAEMAGAVRQYRARLNASD